VLTRIQRALEATSELSGRAVSWLVPGLTLLVCYDVADRYLLRGGSVALQELEWHLFALIFLLGAAYTFRHEGHVRIEIFYQSLSARGRAAIDLLGHLLFLLPFCALVIYASVPFVVNAWQFGEGSPDPGGLPWRFLLKAAIPAGFALLALQGIAGVIACIVELTGRREER